jgi:hypothetical protein
MKPIRPHEVQGLIRNILLPAQSDDPAKQEQQNPSQTANLDQRHHVYGIIAEAAPDWKHRDLGISPDTNQRVRDARTFMFFAAGVKNRSASTSPRTN